MRELWGWRRAREFWSCPGLLFRVMVPHSVYGYGSVTHERNVSSYVWRRDGAKNTEREADMSQYAIQSDLFGSFGALKCPWNHSVRCGQEESAVDISNAES